MFTGNELLVVPVINNGIINVDHNSQEKYWISRMLIINLYDCHKILTDTLILGKRHLYFSFNTCAILEFKSIQASFNFDKKVIKKKIPVKCVILI